MKTEPETSAEQKFESRIVFNSTDHSQMNDQQEMPPLTDQQETKEEPERGAPSRREMRTRRKTDFYGHNVMVSQRNSKGVKKSKTSNATKAKYKQTIVQPQTIYVATFIHVTLYTATYIKGYYYISVTLPVFIKLQVVNVFTRILYPPILKQGI